MNACEAGQIQVIQTLVNFDRELLNYKCENGTPIHAAITGKDPTKTVNYLLSVEKSISNNTDLTGVSPLFLAVYTGKTDIVNALITSGCDPIKSTTPKFSPLHICAERGLF